MNSEPTSFPDKLRWGILSTARIVRKNWPAMLESGSATLVAVASRDVEKAREFICEMQGMAPWPVEPDAIGSYEELLERPDIDAVYIPSPTAIRKEWVIRAAEAGKHVLCEKPCANNLADLKEMLTACAEHHRLFMDGVMFMHDPRYQQLREVLDDGESVGNIRRITSAFSFMSGPGFAENDIRARFDLEPAGCLGDLGWYCLRAALWAKQWEMPVQVRCRMLDEDGEDRKLKPIMSAAAELDFADGTTASFYCSFLTAHQSWLHLTGSAGEVRVNDFVAPKPENPDDYEIGYRRIAKPEPPGKTNAARMFSRFAHDVAAGPREIDWNIVAFKTQVLLDACVKSCREGGTILIQDDD